MSTKGRGYWLQVWQQFDAGPGTEPWHWAVRRLPGRHTEVTDAPEGDERARARSDCDACQHRVPPSPPRQRRVRPGGPDIVWRHRRRAHAGHVTPIHCALARHRRSVRWSTPMPRATVANCCP